MWKHTLAAYGSEYIQIEMKEMKALFALLQAVWERHGGRRPQWAAGVQAAQTQQYFRRSAYPPPVPPSPRPPVRPRGRLTFILQGESVCVSSPAWSQTSAKLPWGATGSSLRTRRSFAWLKNIPTICPPTTGMDLLTPQINNCIFWTITLSKNVSLGRKTFFEAFILQNLRPRTDTSSLSSRASYRII